MEGTGGESMSVTVSDDKVDYNIRTSTKAVGYLYPTIVDKHDRIIDGQHRLKVDPDWPCYRLSHIETMTDFLMARIIANVHRRQVSPEEKTAWLSELAEETGWGPNELAEKLAVSYRWVMKYLPPEAKIRPGAGGPRKPPTPPRVARRATQKLSEARRPPEPPRGFLLNKDYQDTDRFLDGLENLSFCLRPGDQLTTQVMSWCRTKKVHWSTIVVEGLKLFFAAQGEE